MSEKSKLEKSYEEISASAVSYVLLVHIWHGMLSVYLALLYVNLSEQLNCFWCPQNGNVFLYSNILLNVMLACTTYFNLF